LEREGKDKMNDRVHQVNVVKRDGRLNCGKTLMRLDDKLAGTIGRFVSVVS
jgi:hypothetical protein